MTKLRFAPSPTGRLHLGNLRTALVNFLYARHHGGTLLLRIDDTDLERSSAEHARSIEQDLVWLGLFWDDFARQSDRMALYAAAAERLKAAGRLYPCFESPEELALKRKLLLARGRPPVYDRAALSLSPTEIEAKIAAGERPTWRFKLAQGRIEWRDLVRGEVGFGAETFSDPVLIRGDGVPLYTLATVVDDIDFGITQILRGEDHVANTAIHVQLFEALGGRVPEFGHFALIADAEGGKLSKRAGALSIAELREAGLEPMALLSLLARLGTSDPIDLRPDLATLIAEFDIARFGRSPPKLDTEEFWHLNAKLLHHMDFATARPRLPEGASEAFWLAVRGNLTRIEEAADWWEICTGGIETPPPEDPDLLAAAAGLLPETLDQTSWKTWTASIKSATGKGGRALFHPLRLALTGRETGPELAGLLPLIGRTRVLERLGARPA